MLKGEKKIQKLSVEKLTTTLSRTRIEILVMIFQCLIDAKQIFKGRKLSTKV